MGMNEIMTDDTKKKPHTKKRKQSDEDKEKKVGINVICCIIM